MIDGAFSAPHLFETNICGSRLNAHIGVKEIFMFIAQLLLCSSIAIRCIGVEDETGLVSNVEACQKRIEEMVTDARELMPQFVVVHVDCKQIEGFAV